MRTALRLLALPALAATLMTGTVAQASGFSCRETPIVRSSAVLASVGRRVAQGQPLAILAIGSSSTEGIGASAKDRTYPARLQALLGKAWPKSRVEIANAGIGGEIAPQTLARLKTLLAERHYDLVIWQVGTNDAIRGGDLDAFRAMIGDGIALVKQAGPALAILDPQFFPSMKEPERYATYVAAVGEVARREGVPVFARYEAMNQWHRADAEAFKAALWTDGFHMSDAGYDCLARDMALSLTEMATPTRPVMAQSR
ncbi:MULTISPECIES: SGNH/GDSL hydrolase family protein [unclassified Bosea (in: a-proteobacteria)]|uniref:SGNH/GDSL hydrolase family protein n=1 Tax=unclassified Bosea (in: a-proteobacteria) TaxID=2653178 RepID=UPI00095426FF|nr:MULTISPECIES: SGNH/GDSL hydrolase family protein [unclassified Bosea (in: a-proteobacteria)]TAJ27721.1 MAG: SGNH/GDSL hydrolase family protein [Bosea sp. (in: a-proteobacteria)]SIQ11684.1 Lysophospholipase L1 [Bosea sp. TND4EK4]